MLLVKSATTVTANGLGIRRPQVLEAVAALNIPVGAIQLPIVISRQDKKEWMPVAIDLLLWRAVTWPVIGMLFWWIAGRAVEALVSIGYGQIKPRISWIEAISGLLVMAACGIVFLALLIGLFIPGQDHGFVSRFAAGGGLWALLGSLSVIACYRQSYLRKRLANSQPIAAQLG